MTRFVNEYRSDPFYLWIWIPSFQWGTAERRQVDFGISHLWKKYLVSFCPTTQFGPEQFGTPPRLPPSSKMPGQMDLCATSHIPLCHAVTNERTDLNKGNILKAAHSLQYPFPTHLFFETLSFINKKIINSL